LRLKSSHDPQRHLGTILNQSQELGPVAAPPADEPPPVVHALPRPANRPPGAPPQADVEQYDCVGTVEPHLGYVVGAKVAVEDPRIAADELLLHLDPSGRRCWLELPRPEHLVELDQWDPGRGGEPSGERRLACRSPPEDHNPLHGAARSKRWNS